MTEQTVTLYKCDKCKKVLINPDDGLVIHGNIYAADTADVVKSLVGDNFPTEDQTHFGESHAVTPGYINNAVEKTVFCVPCFLHACLRNHSLSAYR